MKQKNYEKGRAQWTDDVFIIAKKIMLILMLNYQIAKKTYTIEKYQNIFLMN